MKEEFRKALIKTPVVAVLRNILPDSAKAVGEALISAGIGILEVPLNGADAHASIEILVKNFGEKALIGAGTALTPDHVKQAARLGAKFIFSPNLDADVVETTLSCGMASVPGVATPSEAFTALRLGSTALKAFPGDMLPPKVMRAWRLVLPKDAIIILAGGVNADNSKSYMDAGVDGFGATSAFFAPGMPSEEVEAKARKFLLSMR